MTGKVEQINNFYYLKFTSVNDNDYENIIINQY